MSDPPSDHRGLMMPARHSPPSLSRRQRRGLKAPAHGAAARGCRAVPAPIRERKNARKKGCRLWPTECGTARRAPLNSRATRTGSHADCRPLATRHLPPARALAIEVGSAWIALHEPRPGRGRPSTPVLPSRRGDRRADQAAQGLIHGLYAYHATGGYRSAGSNGCGSTAEPLASAHYATDDPPERGARAAKSPTIQSGA